MSFSSSNSRKRVLQLIIYSTLFSCSLRNNRRRTRNRESKARRAGALILLVKMEILSKITALCALFLPHIFHPVRRIEFLGRYILNAGAAYVLISIAVSIGGRLVRVLNITEEWNSCESSNNKTRSLLGIPIEK
ncbi:Uncharacterized protein Fot_05695 [Forsythia ovata]|uniref:Uncharacterized protein n=1 Tax=Forsythia ovata TaxID=205694 RepID=A0ABD1WQV7_9LAMI